MPRRREPRWVTRRMLDVIHDAQIREHGGTAGIRDEGLLESALARPQQKWAYAAKPDVATLAASLSPNFPGRLAGGSGPSVLDAWLASESEPYPRAPALLWAGSSLPLPSLLLSLSLPLSLSAVQSPLLPPSLPFPS